MLCDKCCDHMHRLISLLQGKTVNCLSYGCEWSGCDRELRDRFDDLAGNLIQKRRDDKFKAS